jgi:hypothetical protein
MGQSWIPGIVNNFHFSKSSIAALGSTESPIQFHGGKAARGEADHSPTTADFMAQCLIR